MLDHVSITVSDIAAAERFYDAILKALDVVKVGRRDDWLGYGERARGVSGSASTSRSATARNPKTPPVGTGASRRNGGPRSTPSGMPGSPPAAATTARRACATITRPITEHSCATRTATGSKPSAITRSD